MFHCTESLIAENYKCCLYWAKIRLLKYDMVNHRISALDGDNTCWFVHPKSIKRFSPATIVH